jgi:uncharacterized protein (DUF1499 family)
MKDKAEMPFAPCPSSPNCVSSLETEDDKHRVEPLTMSGDPAQSKARLRQAIFAAGDATFVRETDTYWKVEYRSRFFRFVDDVEFWFGCDTNAVHVRSASRLGYSDFGVNRKRIEKIRVLMAS